jgi:hypothetical protein
VMSKRKHSVFVLLQILAGSNLPMIFPTDMSYRKISLFLHRGFSRHFL